MVCDCGCEVTDATWLGTRESCEPREECEARCRREGFVASTTSWMKFWRWGWFVLGESGLGSDFLDL